MFIHCLELTAGYGEMFWLFWLTSVVICRSAAASICAGDWQALSGLISVVMLPKCCDVALYLYCLEYNDIHCDKYCIASTMICATISPVQGKCLSKMAIRSTAMWVSDHSVPLWCQFHGDHNRLIGHQSRQGGRGGDLIFVNFGTI